MKRNWSGAGMMLQQQYEDYTLDPLISYQPEQPDVVLKLRGLPWACTVEDILEFFGSDVNVANGADGIHLITTPEGRSSGEAFVDITTEEDLHEGLKKNKNSMGHRYIEVFKVKRAEMDWILRKNSGADYDGGDGGGGNYGLNAGGYGGGQGGGRGMPSTGDGGDGSGLNSLLAGLDQAESATFVRLRGLPFECSKNDIYHFFTGLEIDPNGVHMVDDGSGRNTGEAYVQFTSKEDAEKALQQDRQCIGHRYIEVFRVGNTEMRSIDMSMSMGLRGRPQPGYSHRPGPYDRPRNDGGGGRGGRYGGGGGRPQRYFGAKKERFDEDNWNTYANEVGSWGARGGNGNLMDPPPPPPPPLIPGLKRTRPGGMSGNDSFGGNDNSRNWLLMRGLPFRATEDDILEFFEPIAPLAIHIIFDSSNRPSGTAKVNFSSAEDLNLAMGKHKNLMEHRYIELFPGGF